MFLNRKRASCYTTPLKELEEPMNRLVLSDVRFYPLEPNEFCRLPGNARNIRLPLGPLGAVDTREARVVA